MNNSNNLDSSEIAKFDAMANNWWDPKGPCEPLHILNPTRTAYIQRHTELANKRILDVGCGAGLLTETLHSKGADVTGIDASSEVISAAKQHASANNLQINYLTSTIEDYLVDTKEKFDVITCMELIEHVPDPNKLIKDCASLLKPEGKIFLSTLNRTLKAYVFAIIGAEYVLNILPKHTHDYKKFIKPAELNAMLKSSSLTLNDISGLKYDPFTKTASLYDSLSINYLCCATKET